MKKANVLIISNYYYPDVSSIANLYKQLADFLSKDMNVTVLCAVPSYLGVISKEYINGKFFISSVDGVKVIRIGVPSYDKTKKTSRIKHLYYFFVRSIFSYNLIGRQDVILAVSQPPVFGGIIGYILKKKTKAKLIYNIQDFNPEQMVYSGFSKSHIIINTLLRIDNYLCRNSDYVITVSNEMRQTLLNRLKNKKVPPNCVISNWVDTSKINKVEKENNPLIEKYGLKKTDFLVVYAGNIGIMQNLKTFIKAAYKLQKYSDIKFVFIGSGAWRNDMVEMIEKMHLKNVLLEPYEPIENINLVYSLGDIEIVSIGKNVTKCSMPSKTWNILSCGVPVICQVDSNSELNELINNNEIGCTIAPNDYESLAKKIIDLYHSQQSREIMGKNARKLAVEQFDISVSLPKYREIILKLYGESEE